MHKAFKYRIYPNKSQKVLLSKTFGCIRVIWNANVESFNSYDKDSNPKPKIIIKSDLIIDKPWLNEISAAAIQQKIRDFQEITNQFFSKTRKKKIGRPSFKKKSGNQSYRLPNQKFSLKDNKIRLEKIGWVKISIDRNIPDNSKMLSCTISMNCCGQYFVSILVDVVIPNKGKTGKSVGIDLGLKSFATLSDGVVIDNIKFFREKQSEIAKIQRHLSRKNKGSNRHRKNKIKIARLYNKIANKRNNFLHNVTTSLVNNYDVICIEDLNVSGMLSNHKLAKAISDTSFSMFRSMLEYKCNWYGKELVVIDRFYPSSKTCSKCGWKKEDLTLSDRVFKCENCGIEIDRDLNAAINIQRVGVDILYNRMQRDEVTNLNEASIME
jgi:transposase, IS605 orfB family|nr:MAG TPA: endonuclease [Caudoviricetes sp.]